MMQEAKMHRFRVNGETFELMIEPSTPILHVLRNVLKLKGTRFGCGLGECGACTILIDGAPVTSCNSPIELAEGKEISTVEGLAKRTVAGDIEDLHPVQRCLVSEQAIQCGYCISGILMRCIPLLESNPLPSETEVREALDRNLCRCGSHNRIVKAVVEASRGSGQEGGLHD